jgi:hypothetical protein
MRPLRNLWRWTGLALATLTPLAICAHAAPSLEYAIKAAYLTKFISFITWPPGSFEKPDSPVTICLVGDDPFDGALDEAARSARVGERPIAVRHLIQPDDDCRMVFVPAGDPDLAAQTLQGLKGRPVATVTDSGIRPRGIISFVIAANHVRFDIDVAKADQNGLSISSKLLGLAHAVHVRGRP